MKVHGTFALEAPRDVVFRAICDPAVLMAVIPGCEAIEQAGPAEYRGRITLRLPGMVGSYRTTVRLVDAVAPEHAALQGRLEGALGSIVGRADFVLTGSAGGTVVEYRGQGVIEGPLARLNSRFAEGLAGSMIAQALRALDARLAREQSGGAGGGGSRSSAEVAG